MSYVGQHPTLELKDRANSINTHKHLYNNILSADSPTNIDKVVDRKVQPYGEDKSLEIINSIFKCAGMSIHYTEDQIPNYEYIELEGGE
jgi:hypothetical protein